MFVFLVDLKLLLKMEIQSLSCLLLPVANYGSLRFT